MRSILIALAVVVSARAARADVELDKSAESLSLPELFAIAVRVAPALESSAFSLAAATAQRTAANGPYDIDVTAIADYQRSRGAPPVPGLPGDQSVTATYFVSLKKLMPSNGTLELLGITTDAQTNISGFPTDTIESSVRLRLTQPLLKGVGAAGYDKVRDVARLHLSAATIRRSADARSFAFEVVQAYWLLALAWRELDIRRNGLELARKQQAFVEGGIRTGKYSQSELLPVQEAVATRQQDILAAELDVLDRSIALRRLVGLDVKPESLAVRPAELPTATAVPLEVEPLVARAIATSDELKAAIADEKSGQAALAGSRRDLLPRVDLRVEGGPLGTDVTAADAMNNITHRPSIAGSLGRLRDGYLFGANLTVEVPIGNHAVKGAYAADRSAAANLAFQVTRTRADVVADVARTVQEARVHLESAQLGATAAQLAEANVDAEQKKFEIGKSSSVEIVRRQDDLQIVRLREALERASYQVALAKLDAATGTILEKYGVSMVDRWFGR